MSDDARLPSVFPGSGDDLRAFLDRFDRGTVFEVSYTEDGRGTTRLLTGIHRPRPSELPVDGPDRDEAFVARSLEGEERTILPVAEVDRVALPRASEVPFEAGGLGTADRAKHLAYQAREAPGSVDPAALFELVDVPAPEARERALVGVGYLVGRADVETDEVVECLERALDDDSESVRTTALRTLERLAADDPAAVAPAVPAVVDQLPVDPDRDPRGATGTLVQVAAEEPGHVVDAVPALAPLLEGEGTTVRHAVYAVAAVAGEYPEAVRPAVPQLVGLLDADDDEVRTNASSALGRIASEYPEIAADVVPDLVALLDGGDAETRSNAVGLLADVALQFPGKVSPEADRVVAALDDPDPMVRSNAAAAVSRLAEYDADAVEGAVPPLVDRLDDDDPVTRRNACLALGYLGGDGEVGALERLEESDPDEEVRRRARWALGRIG